MRAHVCNVVQESAVSQPGRPPHRSETWRITCVNVNCDFVEKAGSKAVAKARADRHRDMPKGTI